MRSVTTAIIKWLLIYLSHSSLRWYFVTIMILWYFDIIMILLWYYQMIVNISFVCKLMVIFWYYHDILRFWYYHDITLILSNDCWYIFRIAKRTQLKYNTKKETQLTPTANLVVTNTVYCTPLWTIERLSPLSLFLPSTSLQRDSAWSVKAGWRRAGSGRERRCDSTSFPGSSLYFEKPGNEVGC